jgi:DNA-binding MarR family transcriptional regulator
MTISPIASCGPARRADPPLHIGRSGAGADLPLDIVRSGKHHVAVGKGKGDGKGKGRKARHEAARLATLLDVEGPAPEPAHVAQRLTGITLHLLRRLAREEQVTGIRPARLSALSTLTTDGPTTLGGLAKRERVTPPSMTRLVHALEAEGLVERLPSASDGRQVGVRITAAGRQLLDERSRARADAVAGWLRPLDDEQLRVVDAAVTLLDGSLRDANG